MYRLLGLLDELPKIQLMVIAIGTVLVLGFIDYFTGTEFSLSFFYLLPVAIMAWAGNKNSGLVFSVLCASVWLTTNLLAGQILSTLFVGVWNTLIRFGFFATVAILLAELRHALDEERILANTDPLTGVLNRRSFNDIIEKKMIIAEVNKRPYTMVYIDLDNFKAVNDSLGHAVGDLVLRSVVDTTQKHIRNTDFLARLGGDEFAILLTDADQENARLIVERLQSSLLEEMKSKEWGITFSIGVLTVMNMPESVDKLIQLTDTLMYRVKNSGRNAIRYALYED